MPDRCARADRDELLDEPPLEGAQLLAGQPQPDRGPGDADPDRLPVDGRVLAVQAVRLEQPVAQLLPPLGSDARSRRPRLRSPGR